MTLIPPPRSLTRLRTPQHMAIPPLALLKQQAMVAKLSTFPNQPDEGEGLDMYIVQNIVNKYNEIITLESQEGNRDNGNHSVPLRVTNLRRNKKCHIRYYVVDDEEEVRKTIRLQLKGTGLEVIEAEEKGIEVLDAENVTIVDAILCDVRMPNINGVEAVAYFRREYPHIPVIVLTGYPDVKLAMEFIKEGVVEYLVKPVEKEKLIEVVMKAIDQRTFVGGTGPKCSEISICSECFTNLVKIRGQSAAVESARMVTRRKVQNVVAMW